MRYKSYFCDWMRRRIGTNWILTRRTNRVLRQYGDDVVTLSCKQYKALQNEYEKETGLDVSGGPSRAVIDRAVGCHDELVAALGGMLGDYRSDGCDDRDCSVCKRSGAAEARAEVILKKVGAS